MWGRARRVVCGNTQFCSPAELSADTVTGTARCMIAIRGGLADVERDPGKFLRRRYGVPDPAVAVDLIVLPSLGHVSDKVA